MTDRSSSPFGKAAASSPRLQAVHPHQALDAVQAAKQARLENVAPDPPGAIGAVTSLKLLRITEPIFSSSAARALTGRPARHGTPTARRPSPHTASSPARRAGASR
jgi:hypothetical protein